MPGHMDPQYFDHPWWGFVGWLVPLLIVAMLVGLAVWVVARTTRQQPGAAPATSAPPTPPAPTDAALERARMRYAQGEIGRDEFVQLVRDLGGPAAASEAVGSGE